MPLVPTKELDRLIKPNRHLFREDVDALIGNSRRASRQIAVLIVDAATPNQYEELIRTRGQAAADFFEEAAADSISRCLPEGTALYSLSAMRFGCILEIDTPDYLKETLDKLAYRMRRPEPVGHPLPVATSIAIGAACYPEHGTDAVTLIQAAISGAHESLTIDSPWCLYSPARDRASHRAAYLLHDIGPALAGNGQLHLVYQPKMDLETGRYTGAEALLRWHHPTLGEIPPGEFVELVERTTFVQAITEWTLGAALPQVARWRAAGLDPQVSVNVSMRDLGDDNFATRLAGLLERHAVRPEWINIEITESALMKNPLRVRRQLDEIRRLGVEIEIDDYGAGYAGLSYLKYIPAAIVKIDQAFISQLAVDRNDQIMVRSTIGMVHDLGRQVVAEGVRDQSALDWLRDQGCDIGQGHFISRPLEAPLFEQSLRAQLQPSAPPMGECSNGP